MKSERNQFNKTNDDSGNGYRMSSVLADGGKLELVVPGSRHENFYPLILALIKDQNQESQNIAFELYQAEVSKLQRCTGVGCF